MRLLFISAVVTGFTVLASCGGGEGKSDPDQIRETVSGYSTALSGKKPARLCDLLITRKIAEASKKDRDKQLDSCRKRIKNQDLSGAPKPQKVEVADIKVNGSKATAKVSTGAGKQRQSGKISFRRVDGSWRILTGG